MPPPTGRLFSSFPRPLPQPPALGQPPGSPCRGRGGSAGVAPAPPEPSGSLAGCGGGGQPAAGLAWCRPRAQLGETSGAKKLRARQPSWALPNSLAFLQLPLIREGEGSGVRGQPESPLVRACTSGAGVGEGVQIRGAQRLWGWGLWRASAPFLRGHLSGGGCGRIIVCYPIKKCPQLTFLRITLLS